MGAVRHSVVYRKVKNCLSLVGGENLSHILISGPGTNKEANDINYS